MCEKYLSLVFFSVPWTEGRRGNLGTSRPTATVTRDLGLSKGIEEQQSEINELTP